MITSFTRLKEYYTRHGFRPTIRRAILALRRALFANSMVVFYCDLDKQNLPPVALPSSFQIQRVTSETALIHQDWDAMVSMWNPTLARRNMNERFAKGAALWLVKVESQLAGYGWTLQGRTIERYYFPLGPNDVHLFDFHVFAQYRGQGINPLLVAAIVRNLATNGRGRAFIEAAEWNEAQISSLRKTSFQRLGLARSFTVFGHKFISWVESETQQQTQKGAEPGNKALRMAKSHE
jgi:ribosomal protein S18 acetylase RimI-like enzyme